MTFLEYLKGQRNRADPIGDLARDTLMDRKKLRGDAGYEAWEKRLDEVGASDHAIEALREAFREYGQPPPPDPWYDGDPDDDEEGEEAGDDEY